MGNNDDYEWYTPKDPEEKARWQRGEFPELNDPEFWGGVISDVYKLVEILRSAEFDDQCAEGDHALGLCTICIPNIDNFVKRMRTYKEPLNYLSRPSSKKTKNVSPSLPS